MKKRTFYLRRKVLGEEHPDTLHSLNNVAMEHGMHGRSKSAYDLFIKTFDMRKRVLGEKHPDTL